jgi:glycosyltransferase involved in cell wall biosynthesis
MINVCLKIIIPFEELKQEIRRSRFVLVPYAAESILSSGILMDSLSFGAKVIGPAVGSFRDYAAEPLLNVYTFHTFDDIQDLVGKANEATDIAGYNRFLNAHSWNEFGKKFQNLLQKIIQ